MSPRRAKVLRDRGDSDSPGALRRHLITVTQHLLAAHGLIGLTTRQIAREAEVSDGVLYNHFAGKDELVLAALGERATELVRDFLAALPEPGAATLEQSLAQLARAVLEFSAGIVPLVTGLLGQADLLHAFFSGIHADRVGPQAAFAATVEYVAAEQHLGRVADDVDPVAVAQLLFGACQLHGLVSQLRSAEDGAPEQDVVPAADLDAIVVVLLRALRPAR